MQILGIDIGGSGIKGAPVEVTTGKLAAERFRIPTPRPATPEACAAVVREILGRFEYDGPVGCGYPGVVQSGIVKTAVNVHPAWLDLDASALFEDMTGCPFVFTNDADAAGIAEMRFGAGRHCSGLVLMVTIGTGLGTALFTDGHLVPNLELGHIEIHGRDAERWASDAARKRKDLSWKKWAKRFDDYLNRLHAYLWPDLIVLGGGASKKPEKFLRHLDVPCEVVTAELRNEAGIVGAALAAEGLT
jgi:polyphosphate glucokinase